MLIISFSWNGIGPIKTYDKLNKEIYISYLNEQVLPYINELFEQGDFKILHDNHPVHTANDVKDWFTTKFGENNNVLVDHPPK